MNNKKEGQKQKAFDNFKNSVQLKRNIEKAQKIGNKFGTTNPVEKRG